MNMILNKQYYDSFVEITLCQYTKKKKYVH